MEQMLLSPSVEEFYPGGEMKEEEKEEKRNMPKEQIQTFALS
jgi:hypothetical protein